MSERENPTCGSSVMRERCLSNRKTNWQSLITPEWSLQLLVKMIFHASVRQLRGEKKIIAPFPKFYYIFTKKPDINHVEPLGIFAKISKINSTSCKFFFYLRDPEFPWREKNRDNAGFLKC